MDSDAHPWAGLLAQSRGLCHEDAVLLVTFVSSAEWSVMDASTLHEGAIHVVNGCLRASKGSSW